jgi:cobyrinic acid a,c-diamide synthase
MTTASPRLVIAGLSGDGGKTITTLSVLSALRARGLSVSAFKKGPDYIDPAWIGRAAGTVCRNLDTYLVDPRDVLRGFVEHSAQADVAVIEGNRGMFDGKDVAGTHSTAELAKLLRAPVVLVVEARKATRTIAALVKGCIDFDPDVEVAGVVLNRVAGRRHVRVVRESIAEYTGVPVLGAVPDLGDDAALIPGRHLGLVPPSEFDPGIGLDSKLEEVAAHLDVEAMLEVARRAAPLSSVLRPPAVAAPTAGKVGYFRDSVFTFYYPENLEALEEAGATLVPVSSLDDAALPEVDAFYIGGGFPETHAQRLAENQSMMASVREAALSGLPLYAECGGLIYLAASLQWGGSSFPMSGVFPVDLEMHARPVGHGYTLARVDKPNPFYPVGTTIRGHEFHYSGLRVETAANTCMTVATGTGLGSRRDGLVIGNTLACYTHIHAEGMRDWAVSFVRRAAECAVARSAIEETKLKQVERHATWQK